MGTTVGKHILTGRPVEMTRQPDGNLLFKVVARPSDPPFTDGIAFEINQRQLKSAFGTAGIVVSVEGRITHRECGCPVSRCTCPPLIKHAFDTAYYGTPPRPDERCKQCGELRARHRDWRCELHNADPCAVCHPPRKGAAQ